MSHAPAGGHHNRPVRGSSRATKALIRPPGLQRDAQWPPKATGCDRRKSRLLSGRSGLGLLGGLRLRTLGTFLVQGNTRNDQHHAEEARSHE